MTETMSSSHEEPCAVLWKRLRSDFIKCNVDAMVLNNNSSAGFGVVIQNNKGNFIAEKATPISFHPCT